MAKTKTAQYTEVVPGVLVQKGVSFSKGAAERYMQPLVGKTIERVQLQEDPEGGRDPEIVLCFSDGSHAFILMDAEGNGPGFIEFIPKS